VRRQVLVPEELAVSEASPVPQPSLVREGSPVREEADRLSQPSLRDQVIASLRDRILACELTGGQRLDVAELAREYRISQGPVREALIVLEAEGVVRAEARRGVYVSEITHRDLAEIYQVREAVEVMCVAVLLGQSIPAPTIDRQGVVAELEERLARIEQAWGVDDWGEAMAADMDFHCTLADLTGNRRMARVTRTLADQTLLHLGQVTAAEVALRRRPPTSEHHEAIVLAIAAGSPARAEAAVRAHYDWSRRRLADPRI